MASCTALGNVVDSNSIPEERRISILKLGRNRPICSLLDRSVDTKQHFRSSRVDFQKRTYSATTRDHRLRKNRHRVAFQSFLSSLEPCSHCQYSPLESQSTTGSLHRSPFGSGVFTQMTARPEWNHIRIRRVQDTTEKCRKRYSTGNTNLKTARERI